MNPGVAAVAKKKASEPTKGGLPDDRVVIIHLKGSREFAAWLDDIHKKTDIPKTTIFRRAVEDWAASRGFGPPPEI